MGFGLDRDTSAHTVAQHSVDPAVGGPAIAAIMPLMRIEHDPDTGARGAHTSFVGRA